MWLFGISLIPYLIFSIHKSKKSIHMLQQNFYDENRRYLLWILKNPDKSWINLDLFFPVLIALQFLPTELAQVGFALFYILMLIVYSKKTMTEQSKKPLVVTARVKRLSVTIALIYAITISAMILLHDPKMLAANYVYLAFITYLNYLVILVANTINYPVERCVFNYFKSKAMKKIKLLNIPVIGITGSYGKTSSKNIINDILNVRYNSYATPKSYNTAYGVIRTINENLDKFNDFFVVELGAFVRGEIARSCKLVKPKYGVLTVIGEAHMDTFGSRRKIQKGKFELIESLPPDGFGILNGDDEYQLKYKLKNDVPVYWIGIENEDVDLRATNIELSHQGTKFDVKFRGNNKIYSFQTKLLGQHNIYNILGGILLGYKLGMNIDDLIRGVARIAPIEHRLEMKKIGSLNIIDDAYNSNPVGSKMAVEILGMMPGTKIVVTPGMIELGDNQYEANRKFGTYIASSADYAILIGKEQTKPIYDGLKESKFPEDKIHILNDVKDAFTLMKHLEKGETYVLLENDLPDLFNE